MSANPQSAAEAAIHVANHGDVAVVTLNRPARINAINNEIRRALPAALLDLECDPAIRVIVLHGGAARGFCVGADIAETRESEAPVAVRRRMMRESWIDAFDRTTKPLVAAIHGFCLGGGLEIALACDIRIASIDAQFSLPETGLGLIPGAGGTQRLHRIIGMGRALDLMLTGDRIGAIEAHRLGLVTRLVDEPGGLLSEALELAHRIAMRPPSATVYAKEAVRAGADLHLAAGLAMERSLFAILSATDDKTEAASAFVEKRTPRFTGE